MLRKMRYRLALDIGTGSIGWCLLRLGGEPTPAPVAVIRMGVRLFNDGREPARPGEVGSSLAVSRRMARQMRRRRDRLIRRRSRLIKALVELGFWPEDAADRRALANLDPYELRAKGLDSPLSPAEFGRVLFHLNQRRGFRSNRKTDKRDSEAGLLKSAIRKLKDQLATDGARTVGEWLAWRHRQRVGVRARLRGSGRDAAYDLYIDRDAIAQEFDALWAAQAAHDPNRYDERTRQRLRQEIFHQRALRPVRPGRCTLIPDQPRAALALPSVQRFRIYQELNNLRILTGIEEAPLTLAQRDTLAEMLEHDKVTFAAMRKALKLPAGTKFNLEDAKRKWLNGNATARNLSASDCFGGHWFSFSAALQDEIVGQLVNEQDSEVLVAWLVDNAGVDSHAAERIADVGLPEGFGSLSLAAIERVLPALQAQVITFDKAVVACGLGTHSGLSLAEQTGEVMASLPYYGEALQRHVGFADPDAGDDAPPERRFGRIANPTVHIGLNELRKVVNKLIDRYGHPSQVVVEVARELKQGQEQRRRDQERQAARQHENEQNRQKVLELMGADYSVKPADLRRMRLWQELNPGDAADRRCPYTGEVIGMAMLFSNQVEIEHILPFSMTLDDSLNNQTVALRRANRDKGNRSPFDAFGHSPSGYDYAAILQRAALMPLEKRKRFAPDGLAQWLRDDKDFLARALTDTAYLSRLAKEYLSLICPANNVWVIPGRLTAMLRGKMGLNKLLGLTGEKNRNDHRHHAVDAAVIGVTDRALLQRFAAASASANERQLDRLVDDMPLPWPTFREHVARSTSSIVVSRRPDHGHEGGLHNDTAYGLRPGGLVAHRVMLDSLTSVDQVRGKVFANADLQRQLLSVVEGTSGKTFAMRVQSFIQSSGTRRVRLLEKLAVIEMKAPAATHRHGSGADGEPLPYKGYKGDSNYCIEIGRDPQGKWIGEVVSTYEANRWARLEGARRLRDPLRTLSGKPLVMRLMIGDTVRMEENGKRCDYRVATISGNGQVFMAGLHEANVDARNRDPQDAFRYTSKMAGSFKTARARQICVNEIGELRDPGFRP